MVSAPVDSQVASLILEQIKTKNVNRKRIGLIGQSKAPVREGTKLFDAQDNEIGIVTSGTYGPSIAKPVAMGYVKDSVCSTGYGSIC